MAHATSITLEVKALPADAITSSSALLRASVKVSLLGANVAFQYGTTTSYGSSSATAKTSLLALYEELRVPITGLTPSTTYHYRAVVWSGSKVKYGHDQWFTTPAAGTAPAPADQGAVPDDSDSTLDPGTDLVPDLVDPAPAVAPDTVAPSNGDGTPADANRSSSGGGAPTTTVVPAYDGPKPVLGESVGAQGLDGTVTVLSPAGTRVPLTVAQALPTGTIIDTTAGTIALTSATDAKGSTQTGRFWGGVFEVRQTKTGKGMTQLVLRGGDFGRCPSSTVTTDAAAAAGVRAHAAATPRGAGARAAAKKKPPRRLWGRDAGGRFETRGRGSVATVRGTRWVTEDWCQGTVTRVLQGAVSVYDLHRRHAKLVKKGHSYFARIGDV